MTMCGGWKVCVVWADVAGWVRCVSDRGRGGRAFSNNKSLLKRWCARACQAPALTTL